MPRHLISDAHEWINEIPTVPINAVKGRVNEGIMAQWQDRWSREEKGAELRAFFPDVLDRMRLTWVEPDYAVSQLLTGHGNFSGRLYDMALRGSAECRCGAQRESRDHVLWDCPVYEEERRLMLEDWPRPVSGPVYFGDLVDSEEGFGRLRRFAHGWLRKASLYERCKE